MERHSLKVVWTPNGLLMQEIVTIKGERKVLQSKAVFHEVKVSGEDFAREG